MNRLKNRLLQYTVISSMMRDSYHLAINREFNEHKCCVRDMVNMFHAVV